MNSKKQSAIAYSALIILSIVFISLCFTNNVWLDEAFTASLVNTNMIDVLKRSMADTLPPLYNILLKLSTSIFGYKIVVMKLTSVLPMILTMFIGATSVRKRFGLTTSLIFMTCITGMPMMLNYGIEIRMYSLGFLFATASGIYAYDVLFDFTKKNCITFAVLSVLAGYSHHFAFVAVGFVYLFMLIYYIAFSRNQIKNWFSCLAITIGLYIPCMIVTLKQLKSVSGYFSMPDVDLHLFIQYAIYPYTTGNTPISLVLLIMVLAVLSYCIFKIVRDNECRQTYGYALCCFIVFYGVLLFGTVISKIMTANIFVDRYLFFSMGLIWLSVSIIIGTLSKSFYQQILLAICSLIILMAFISTYTIQFHAEYDNPATEEIEFIRNNIAEGDYIYTIEDWEEFKFCIPFYAMLSGNNNLTYISSLDETLSKSGSSSGTTWIIVKDGFEISADDLTTMKNYGRTPEYITTFQFERYICDVYKVR